jgi:small subunit ribosomal protein S1
VYPDGFDPATGEWLEGFEEQKAQWEQQYAEAHARWEAHKQQITDAKAADAEATGTSDFSSASGTESPAPDEGSLASDEALQALREKLTGTSETGR